MQDDVGDAGAGVEQDAVEARRDLLDDLDQLLAHLRRQARVLDQARAGEQHREAAGRRQDRVVEARLAGEDVVQRDLRMQVEDDVEVGQAEVGVDDEDALAAPRQRRGEVGGEERLADAALAARHREDARPRARRVVHQSSENCDVPKSRPFSSALTCETDRLLEAGAVAPFRLGAIELLVGALDPEQRRRAHPLRREGAADRDRHRDLLAGADVDAARADMGADPLGDVLGEERRAVGQDHRELLAAEARDRVHRPDALAERDRDVLQDDVAGLVAVGVVDALEVIDVDHQDQRRLAGARDAIDLARQRELEVAPVRQAGERIAARELAEAVDHRLQPGGVAGAAPLRQHMTRLLQQLQRAVEAERASIAERRVDLGGHEVGVSFAAV